MGTERKKNDMAHLRRISGWFASYKKRDPKTEKF